MDEDHSHYEVQTSWQVYTEARLWLAERSLQYWERPLDSRKPWPENIVQCFFNPIIDRGVFRFRTAETATLFKLTWGGK